MDKQVSKRWGGSLCIHMAINSNDISVKNIEI